MSIPFDVWRLVADIGGPLVRYKLRCCSKSMYSAVPPREQSVITAAWISSAGTKRHMLSSSDLDYFWKAFESYESSEYAAPCDLSPTLTTDRTKLVQGYRICREISSFQLELYNDDHIMQLQCPHLNAFHLYDFFDCKKRVDLALRPKQGKRKSSKRRNEEDIVTEQLRYNLVIRIDEYNPCFLNIPTLMEGQFTYGFLPSDSPWKWRDFAHMVYDVHNVNYVVCSIHAFFRSLAETGVSWFYICRPKQNAIQVVIEL